MSRYAILDKDGIVENIIKAKDEDEGKKFVSKLTKNFVNIDEFPNADIGSQWVSEQKYFIPRKPNASWIYDEIANAWKPPIDYPTDGKNYVWNEETISWVEIPQDEE